MDKLNLPQDLVDFLRAGKQLDYNPNDCEPGEVKLHLLSDLNIGVVWINSDESPLSKDDPHFEESGYYEVPAVSLTGECKHYDPEYILLWLPNEQLFGTWDCDHWDLSVFPNVTWNDIVRNPALYIGSQWECSDKKSAEYFKPYPKYEFKEGMPF